MDPTNQASRASEERARYDSRSLEYQVCVGALVGRGSMFTVLYYLEQLEFVT